VACSLKNVHVTSEEEEEEEEEEKKKRKKKKVTAITYTSVRYIGQFLPDYRQSRTKQRHSKYSPPQKPVICCLKQFRKFYNLILIALEKQA
jgi:hypothetical protein